MCLWNVAIFRVELLNFMLFSIEVFIFRMLCVCSFIWRKFSTFFPLSLFYSSSTRRSACLSYLYEWHLHNSNRLQDERPDEFLMGTVVENLSTSELASLENHFFLRLHLHSPFQHSDDDLAMKSKLPLALGRTTMYPAKVNSKGRLIACCRSCRSRPCDFSHHF